MKGLFLKRFIWGVIFIIAGFALAYFAFDYLIKSKQAIAPSSSSLTSTPTIPSLPAKPIQQTPSGTQIAVESLQPQEPKESIEKKPIEKEITVQETTIQKQPAKVKQAPKKEIPTLILNGIFYNKGDNVALINNRIVKEGDLILGLRVTRIYPNKVELDADGEKVTLTVK